MFTPRKTMQILSVAGALLVAGAATAADKSHDRQVIAHEATQEVHSKTGGSPMTCTCCDDSGFRLSPPGTDAEIDALRANGG
jgi:hypothetical protein